MLKVENYDLWLSWWWSDYPWWWPWHALASASSPGPCSSSPGTSGLLVVEPRLYILTNITINTVRFISLDIGIVWWSFQCIPWCDGILRDGWRYQIGWIFGTFPKGRIIFNPKIYIVDFGNFEQGFLIIKSMQNNNFRVQGMFFQQWYWEKSK